MKFTNHTSGPKGVNALSGLVMVEPGQTVDVEITEAEAKSAKATGWFSKAEAEAAPAKDPLDHDNNGKKGGSAPASGDKAKG